MNVPLVQSLDMQLAVRYENYTFFGDIARPKVALSWRPIDWLLFRSSWSQGFRAPNLPQQFEQGILRSNTRSDWVRCEAGVQGGSLANFSGCAGAEGISVQSNRSGSDELQPEESENFTAGFVLESTFLPSRYGTITLTGDYWRVEQEGIVGLLGDANAITLDYLLRMQGDAAGNPNVLRNPVTPDDVTLFTGALDNNGNPLAPVGTITQVIDNYRNFLPRETDGFDIGLYYDLDETPLGDFRLRLNYARLLKAFQDPSSEQLMLLDAQAAGEIDSFPTVPGAESLIEQDGSPKVRASSTLTWRLNNWGAGLYSASVGGVDDTSARLADGTAWRLKPWITHNADVQYTFEGGEGALDEVRVRLGARNITNEQPPLADSEGGYFGDLHSPRGRMVYLSVRTSF
jgi:outer membrane receptor protein involved in Fe transport